LIGFDLEDKRLDKGKKEGFSGFLRNLFLMDLSKNDCFESA